MAMPRELTKEQLIRYGVTDITADGRVFINNHERCIQTITCRHKYGKDRSYHAFAVYDKDLYREQVNEGRKICTGIRLIVLSRAMYAWFYDKADAYMDVDHINSNSLDDRIENLQLLTRQENLAKRLGSKNQWPFVKEIKND